MPLNLAITPVAAPTLTGLSATATMKGVLIAWDALQNATLFAVEIWVSATNNRAAATLLATVTSNYYLHTGLASNVANYYWVRAKNTFGRTDGAWEPVSATAGVLATTLLAQTEDLNPNAATSVVLAQSSAALTQTAYGVNETVFRYTWDGTGNSFVIDAQHLSNLNVTTIGTVGELNSQQTVEVVEHTVYTTGTISVTNASAIVTGSGTLWLANLAAGKIMIMPNGGRYVISTVDTDVQVTLTVAYSGATAAAQSYYAITASVTQMSLAIKTAKYKISGAYCLTTEFPFKHRFPHLTTVGKLYDCSVLWSMSRTDASWAATQSSVLKTLISEEIKR